MRMISTLFSLLLVAGGLYWVANNKPEYKSKIIDTFTSHSLHTLEARFSAEQVMETHRRDLLKTMKHTYCEPTLKYYPYLLMEVKFSAKEGQTGEGVMLWDLVEGEMVTNTLNWEKTHGFSDCMTAGAEKHEFRILNLIAENDNKIDRDRLSRALQTENQILDTWIDSCRKKKLIVQTGNTYRLHLQYPKLSVLPETKLHDRLATKACKGIERINRRFTSAQVRRITECAFGNDFAIRNTIDIYLPVYGITVENPDGSIVTTHWNAVNGKPLPQTSLIH